MAATARLALPRPAGTDLISLGDDNITDLSNKLDAAAMWAKGTFAARPTAVSLEGRFYLATDVGILYLSDGASWYEASRGAADVPLGAMLDYAGAADPADTRFLLADGRAISRTTYAAAFALLGTAYGAGNGTTTFNIPDARGRATVGPDSMGTAAGAAGRMASNNTRGASGGQELTTISTANVPAHAHGVGTLADTATGDHSHGVGTFAVGTESAHTHGVGTFAVVSDGAHSHTSGTIAAATAGSHGHTFTGNALSGHSHGYASADAGFGVGGTLGVILGFNYSTHYSGFMEAASAGTPSGTVQLAGDHTHSTTGSTASAGAHTHGLSGASAAGSGHTHTFSGTSASTGLHQHGLTGSTASVGSGTPINAMGPYLVANKIVRVL